MSSRHPDLGPEDPHPIDIGPVCTHTWVTLSYGGQQCTGCGLQPLRLKPEAEKEVVALLEKGLKFDTGKPRLELLPPAAIEAVGRVLAFGAKKYAPGNWVHVEDGQNRYLAACLRHVFAYMRGEENDSESGEHHLAHAACCLLFILELKDHHERRPKQHP